jgi:hypothetical protein
MTQDHTESPFADPALTPGNAPVPADGEGATRWS